MAADRASPATPRWLKLALVASLSVNLALLGLFGGALLGAGRGDEAERHQPFLFRVLPEARHDEAREMQAAAEAERKALADRRDALAKQLLAAMRAEPFDADRLDSTFKAMNDIAVERRRVTQSQITEIAGRMTPDERAEMAERTDQLLKQWAARRAAREDASN